MTDTSEAPVTGELIAPPGATVQPDQASVNASADRARGRTAVQVGIPGSLVVIGTYVLRLAHIDLDPGAGVDMPAEVVAALVSVLTVLLAFWMNPKS